MGIGVGIGVVLALVWCWRWSLSCVLAPFEMEVPILFCVLTLYDLQVFMRNAKCRSCFVLFRAGLLRSDERFCADGVLLSPWFYLVAFCEMRRAGVGCWGEWFFFFFLLK